MSRCACTCGREAGDKTFAGTACRSNYENRLHRARDIAYAAERPDPALDDLKVPNGNCRRLLAVLRRGPATTAEISQPDVGGLRASARVHELNQLGFIINCVALRPGTFIYTLAGEPTRPAAVTPAVDPRPAPPTTGNAPLGPYDDLDDEAAA